MKPLILLFLSQFLVFSVLADMDIFDKETPQYISGGLLLEANDAGQILTVSEDDYLELTGKTFLENLVNFLNYKRSFSSVAKYITPVLEKEFDIFFIVNVDYEGRYRSSHEVPAQRMKILRKTKRNQKIFVRDESGTVIGIRNDVVGNNGQSAFPGFSDLIKISSGAGHLSTPNDFHDDTTTGIYRINDFLSKRQRYSYSKDNSEVPVMYHSLFYDLKYPDGNVSGLAIHGTNPSQYKYLGTQRSHGCIRITIPQAKTLYENLIVSNKFKGRVPDLDKTKRLKSENGEYRRGVKALFIIFYGYDLKREYWDI